MLHPSLLLCTLYTFRLSVTASSIKQGQPVSLALNTNQRDSWNISGPFSNDTDVGIEAGFSPSLNATGENSGSISNTSLIPFLEPSFETYKNVSLLLNSVHEEVGAYIPTRSFPTNVCSGLISVPATGRKHLTHFSIIQEHSTTLYTAHIAFGLARLSALPGCLLQRYYQSFWTG